MSRKKKLINNTDVPEYAVEKFARCVLDDIRKAYLCEEMQKAFAEWEREMQSAKIKRGLQEKKERAANTAALDLFALFSSWSTGFRFGSYLPTIGKIGVLIPCEINK